MSDATRPAIGGRAAPGAALIVVAAFCYGSNIPFARMAAMMGVSGPDIIAVRVVITLGLLFAALAITGERFAMPRGQWPAAIGLGVATSLVGLCYLWSVAFIPVGVAVMIFYTFPLVVLAVSPLIDGTRLTPLRIGIFIIAFCGIALAIGPDSGRLDWRGLALAAGASLAATAQFFFAARAPGGGGLVTMTAVQLVGLPVAFSLALFMGGPPPLAAYMAAAPPMAMNIGLYCIGFVCQIRGSAMTRPVTAALLFCLEPVVATLSAALLLDERLTGGQYAGGVLVLAAIIANILAEARRS